jgi:hypothetical protein
LLHEGIVSAFEAEQGFHFPAEVFVRAGFLEKECPLAGRALCRSLVQLFEQSPALRRGTHLPSLLNAASTFRC